MIYKLLLPITDDWYAIPIFRTRQCVLWYFAKFMFFYCRFVCIQYSNSCDSCSDLFEYFNESITIAMKYCWYRFLDMVMSMSTNSSVHWEISAWIRISMLRSDSIRVSIIIINATSIGYLIFAKSKNLVTQNEQKLCWTMLRIANTWFGISMWVATGNTPTYAQPKLCLFSSYLAMLTLALTHSATGMGNFNDNCMTRKWQQDKKKKQHSRVSDCLSCKSHSLALLPHATIAIMLNVI